MLGELSMITRKSTSVQRPIPQTSPVVVEVPSVSSPDVVEVEVRAVVVVDVEVDVDVVDVDVLVVAGVAVEVEVVCAVAPVAPPQRPSLQVRFGPHSESSEQGCPARKVPLKHAPVASARARESVCEVLRATS
jgi:hypothetical protein